MKCIYCESELLEGKIQLYEFGSVILKMPATLKFIPNDKTEKNKKEKEKNRWKSQKRRISSINLLMVFTVRSAIGFLLILLQRKGSLKIRRAAGIFLIL